MDEKDGILPESALSQMNMHFHENDLLSLQKLLVECEPLTTEMIDPAALGFVPTESWTSKAVSMQYLTENYFARKNNVNRRFEHKLWNALRITTAFPNLIKIVGVMWVSHNVIKVYKHVFARLLNINSIEGGLFHKQGNFTRHGFILITEPSARETLSPDVLMDVDFKDVVLITHKQDAFTISSTEDAISGCKWDNPVGTPRVAALRLG